MNDTIKSEIVAYIKELEEGKNYLSNKEVEATLLKILVPLLHTDGFNVEHTFGARDIGVDFVATKQEEKIGIEYKYFKGDRKVSVPDVHKLVGGAVYNNFSRVILLTNGTFTQQAIATASQVSPVSIELIDIPKLKNWVSKIEADYNDSEIVIVVKNFTQQIIKLINSNPRILDQIEWRDLERVTAELFDGIGFKVELTPSSKDGGKDVILECTVHNEVHSYIIEIKHWRSGQRVGQKSIKDFVQVITREQRHGGMFLSTYGFVGNAVESLTEVERTKVRVGQEEKIISLCQTYIKRKSGIWNSDQTLPEILFEQTV